ncbi:hypothetical protein A2631_06020 [Candidatus Daviesbacteria bacterium RIFCSPHIGHO2_01_FULL_44_29]|uniref:Uncharacterized protein n=1 Tax=Candidatus Daviesbacteria bacterium RIFCSPHIGHO2_02_FULL_43_12 TaxID=1797776 RepID=A0A1F5KJ58_9BACT|nr:MAG: hypothetical protein A2631_06020 [Candidatus Daviesbacteria bacterium RIFCSPHIGHO2_01_FULL_44_29]OGE39149.1 MAG: hypothetical protein A3E86_03350 [Candidatus Daviesbacteria bacterium RIFCSPHIGHO2_12_FULL_47_45]OGE40952.1 MAG: hypothetical protein A3D25_02850 [Candidatus Daviesbacteria bacterium RIFCSPHIGHO2_02_FULL_43_12]OGE69897.1 MAG: hypothetical protein A3B55_05820 [Candidatus Daviesbacteria bacterium RIFCSPLOWO2_01_FULL_43_15]
MELIGQSTRHIQIAGAVEVRLSPYQVLPLHMEAVLPRNRQGVAAIHLTHPNEQLDIRSLLGQIPYSQDALKNYMQRFAYLSSEVCLAFAFAHDSQEMFRGSDLHLAKIRSNHLVGRALYGRDIKGLGRFLMRNLLSVVDLQGASIGLVASADRDYLRDHSEDRVQGLQLSQDALLAWYQRLGFKLKNELPSYGWYCVREAKEPDLGTDLAKALSLIEASSN